MAVRDKNKDKVKVKMTNAKLDSIVQEFENCYNETKEEKVYETDFTDDEDSSGSVCSILACSKDKAGARNNTPLIKRRRGYFTPFGRSRQSSAASGIFECTTHDNLASRLRLQATRYLQLLDYCFPQVSNPHLFTGRRNPIELRNKRSNSLFK